MIWRNIWSSSQDKYLLCLFYCAAYLESLTTFSDKESPLPCGSHHQYHLCFSPQWVILCGLNATNQSWQNSRKGIPTLCSCSLKKKKCGIANHHDGCCMRWVHLTGRERKHKLNYLDPSIFGIGFNTFALWDAKFQLLPKLLKLTKYQFIAQH
jgi:hypothetical protein